MQIKHIGFAEIKSIHISGWPTQGKKDKTPTNLWSVFIEAISLIRQEKSKAQKPMNSEIILTLDNRFGKWERIRRDRFLSEMLDDLKHVTHAKEIKEGDFNVEFI